jgi:hypothetical protein
LALLLWSLEARRGLVTDHSQVTLMQLPLVPHPH